jgi:hypothetical protein
MLKPTIYVNPTSRLMDELMAELRNASPVVTQAGASRTSGAIAVASTKRASRPSQSVVMDAAG